MKSFIFFVSVLVAALFIITFIIYPADIPVHISLGIALLVAIFGVFKMKKMEGA